MLILACCSREFGQAVDLRHGQDSSYGSNWKRAVACRKWISSALGGDSLVRRECCDPLIRKPGFESVIMGVSNRCHECASCGT